MNHKGIISKSNRISLKNLFFLAISIYLIGFLHSCKQQEKITLESLLDEMISNESMTRFPDPYYTSHQASSFDRGSISPDSVNWFRNGDGYHGGNFMRIDTIDGRIEKVMLDVNTPGVITRFWMTSLDRKPVIRFYFNGKKEPGWIIPAYDLMKFGIEGIGSGLIMPHTSYSESAGGSTSFLPIPYANACKITVEIPEEVDANPRYYQINYRKYDKTALVETFSKKVVLKAKNKIHEINNILLNTDSLSKNCTISNNNAQLKKGDSLLLTLPSGERAIHEIIFEVRVSNKNNYEQCMRELILSAQFDNKETIWVPLGDFSGGGKGARLVSSWFLSSNGKGKIISKWHMPYKKSARICLKNYSSGTMNISVVVKTAKYKWDKNSLYFHTSWKQERGLWLSNCGKDINKPECREWDFARIDGLGIYRGDALTLYNSSKSWYGEGDEKIWIDGDTFPSHFGTGTEDYYNSSWAPVKIFQTPFGGAIRADSTNSKGHNSWLRSRNLDGIPFKNKFQFDLELLSWFAGKADYSSTIYWYGDKNARALHTSGIDEVLHNLLQE